MEINHDILNFGFAQSNKTIINQEEFNHEKQDVQSKTDAKQSNGSQFKQ